MDTFYEPLLELEAFGQIREQLKKEEGLQLITGCVDSQKTHLNMRHSGRMCITILPGISCFFRQIFREMNCCVSGYLQ